MSKARVSYSLQKTVNTGNYENFKIGVELILECEQVDICAFYEQAKKFVRDKVEFEEADLLGKLPEGDDDE